MQVIPNSRVHFSQDKDLLKKMTSVAYTPVLILGGSDRFPTRSLFSPSIIYQFKLKCIYQIQISAIDSLNPNSNNYCPPQFYYHRPILALAEATAGGDEAPPIISGLF